MFFKVLKETKHFKQKPFIFTDVYKIKIDNFSFKHITENVANGHSSVSQIPWVRISACSLNVWKILTTGSCDCSYRKSIANGTYPVRSKHRLESRLWGSCAETGRKDVASALRGLGNPVCITVTDADGEGVGAAEWRRPAVHDEDWQVQTDCSCLRKPFLLVRIEAVLSRVKRANI